MLMVSAVEFGYPVLFFVLMEAGDFSIHKMIYAVAQLSCCLARIAHRQHFPLMAIGFVPVDDVAAVLDTLKSFGSTRKQ